MNLTPLAPGHRPGTLSSAPPSRTRLAGCAWALLIVNVLGTTGPSTLVAVPRQMFQLVTMGAMVGAFALALVVNRRLLIRPSAFLLVLSLLLVSSVLASVASEPAPDPLFRCFRLSVFIATLWLLTRWWHDPLRLLRAHIRAFAAVLATVAVGLLAGPGQAMPSSYEGRLIGIIWPLTAPQVGQFAAVVTGLAIVMWLSRQTDGRSTLVLIVPAIVLLLMSYTRTASLGLLAGLAVAAVALIPTSSRARRMLAGGTLAAALLALALGAAIQAWFRRGQDEEEFANLTGREKVWDALLAQPRSTQERLFGVGLTDKSYDGLPIDSGWLAVYHEQGLLGVALVGLFLTVLVSVAVLRTASPERGAAMFLITFCLVSSYTEVGLGDASPYLMHLALAAALLTPRGPAPATIPTGTGGQR